MIRTFISIEFPEKIKNEVQRIQLILKNLNFLGSFTKSENLHLTLKFLGEISEEQLDEIKTRLNKIVFKPLKLHLGQVGSFNFKNNPRIVWIAVLGESIFKLQASIDEALEGIFQKENQFMSHLTIARIKHLSDKESLKKLISNLSVDASEFIISSFFLKKSELKKDGPIYTTLEEFYSTQ